MKQEKIAEKMIKDIPSKDLITLAKVGIIALVDEATGYQKSRSKDDLRSYSKNTKSPYEPGKIKKEVTEYYKRRSKKGPYEL